MAKSKPVHVDRHRRSPPDGDGKGRRTVPVKQHRRSKPSK